MKIKEEPSNADVYAMWAAWSPRPDKQPVKLTNIVSAIVVATSALHFISFPMVWKQLYLVWKGPWQDRRFGGLAEWKQ